MRQQCFFFSAILTWLFGNWVTCGFYDNAARLKINSW